MSNQNNDNLDKIKNCIVFVIGNVFKQLGGGAGSFLAGSLIGKIENTCSLRPVVCRGRGRSVAYNRPVCQSAMRLRKKPITLEPYEIAQ